MFNVVLVEPEIPPNTGNAGRLCLATGSRLHLIRPLGFSLEDKYLRRAGLDYWESVQVSLWDSLDQMHAARAGADRCWYLTTKCSRPYWEQAFTPGDYLIFGRETKGLPEPLLAAHRDELLTIPMRPETRSLNLSTAVAIVLFEGMRQQAASLCS